MHATRVSQGALLLAVLAGCASEPPARRTGFISDYSRLEHVNDRTSRYVSPRAQEYSKFIVDPVESRLGGGALDDQDRAEALRYMREACRKAIRDAGFTVTDEGGVGVARVRLALTDIASSTWWQKIHPASRALGAGTGGAAMEGEVIDSMTGEQLAAAVQSATGNQFDPTSFSTLADVKSAIDKWGAEVTQRLREIHKARTAG